MAIGLSDQDWGDLNVTSPIDLRGSGASTTTIEADFDFVNIFSRVLRIGSEQIPKSNVFFAIRRLRVMGGNTTSERGGLHLGVFSNVLFEDGIVEDVIVEGNTASEGGGISSCADFSMP